MPFDTDTAVAVIERPDGLFEKDTFDASTAVPVNTVPEIRAPKGPQSYAPPLTDEDRARALLELSYREEGKEVPKGLKIHWALTGQKAKALTKAATMTGVTGGLYPVVEGITGALDNENDLSFMDRVTKGIFYPEETKEVYKKLPGTKDLPKWAQIVASVSESIIKYGVAGIGQAATKKALLTRELAAKIDQAAMDKASEVVGVVPTADAMASKEASTLMTRIDQVKSDFVKVYLSKLQAIDAITMKSGLQEYAERRSIIGMLSDELNAKGVSMGLSIQPVRVGQKVVVKEAGKDLVGKISKIVGNRVEIDVAGKTIMGTIAQLGIPEPIEPKPEETTAKATAPEIQEEKFTPKATEEAKLLEWNKYLKGEGFVTYPSSPALTKFIRNLPENISKREALKQYAEQQKATEKAITQTEKALSPKLPQGQVKPIVRETTGQVVKQPATITEQEALSETLKAQVKAASTAEKVTKEQIFDLQTSMIDILNRTDLELKDKAKFITTIKNANTPEHFEKLLPSVLDKITALEEKATKRALIAEIKSTAQTAKSSDAISIDYANAIQNIVDRYDLKERPEDIREKAKVIESFPVGEQMPEELSQTLDRLLKKPVEEMTSDDLRNLSEELKLKEKLGRTKKRLRESTYIMQKEKIKQDILPDIIAINSKPMPEVPIGDTPNIVAKRYIETLNKLAKDKVSLTPMEGVADVTGMGKVKKALDMPFGKYLGFNDKTFKEWYELTKGFNEGNFNRIGAYAAYVQEGGPQRLENSGQLEQAKNVSLTPEEQKAYDFAREKFDSNFPAVSQYAKEVYNVDVGQVGNYVSFMSDYEAMSDLESYDRFGQRPQEAIDRRTKTVEKGFLEARTARSNVKLELNIDKIFRRHMDDVAYMLTMGKDIKMYYEIVNSPEIREALGDIGAMTWLQWLDLMARKGGVDHAKKIALLDILRQNTGAGVLAYRLSSVLVQLSSYGDAMATIGAGWTNRGAVNIATSAKWRRFMMDNFPEIRKAIGDDIAFREFGEDFIGKAARLGMTPLQVLDGLMRCTTASGSYEKICSEMGIPVNLDNPDPNVIQEATKLMRQSQGSSFFKDQPLAISAGWGLFDNRSINKTFLQFQSFMLARWDNINRQIWRLGIKEKDYNKAITSLLWLSIFGFGGEEVMRRTGRKITQAGVYEKREEAPFWQDMAFNALQSVPLVGSMASSIAYSGNPIPLIRTMNDFISGSKYAVTGQAEDTRIRGLVRALGAALSASGVPGATQAAQLIMERIPSSSFNVGD